MQEHKRWLEIAQVDIISARVLLKNELFTPVVFHCQQASEKVLKAYLAFKKFEILKTHDLVKLLVLCMKFDKTFETLREAAVWLNPFASKFRYPTEYDIPDLADAKFAIKHAQGIMNFVIKKIDELQTGQANIFKIKK
jgi:HEPN domain-containing protein